MTMPHLMNCPHQAEGWCLDCVGKQHAQLEVLRDILKDAMRYAEWHDKHIHPFKGETFQMWTVEINLPVPLSETDKSPEAALNRLLDPPHTSGHRAR